MAENRQNQDQQDLDSQDLDLVDDRLEDEGKDDAALWKEFDHDEAGTAATDDDPDDQSSDQDDEEDGDDDDAADGDDEGHDDDSAAAAGGDEPSGKQTPEGGDKPSGAQRQTQDEVDWANATPEQKAAYEAAQAQIKKLEQAERSNRGRLSALQRQINEFSAKGNNKPGKASPGGDAGQGQNGGDDAEGFLATDDWKSFKDEYPEVAGPLEKAIGTLESQNMRLEKELSAIGNDRRQSALEEQANLLAEEHPDWQDVTAEEGFADWLYAQPRHIQEAAQRNAQDIVDAAEAADVVGRFKAHLSEQGGGNAQQQNNAQPGNNAGRGNQNSKSLNSKRQRQLESASTTRSRGPGAASGIPEDGDPEHIWKQFDEQERRASRA